MATLDNKSVRGTLKAVFKYNDNPDKNRPPDGLCVAAAYISGGHSIEKLYSRGHNGCSGTTDVAIQQFHACEKLYRQNKAGAREAGLADNKQPIIAEHLFLSFPNKENVSYELQCDIVDELCASPLLKDFYAMSNRHWNTDNDHSHILVCAFSKDGTRKLGMNNTKRNALRKELDRICVRRGLSIIDDPALRHNDPEREKFVRQAVGKVDVYAPADYKQLYNPERSFDRWMLSQIAAGNVLVAEGVSKNRKCNQSKAYKRWIASQDHFSREKDAEAAKAEQAILLHEKNANEKAARAYYWDERYRYNNYLYAVSLYDRDGRRKPLLYLMIELILVATNNEYLLMDFHDMGDKREKFFASTNWKIQNGYNAMHFREKHGIYTPNELDCSIKMVGTELAELRQGLAYYKKAYEINPANDYAKFKVENLERRIAERKQAYRELKFVEKHIYDEPMALDDLIGMAEARKTTANDSRRKNEKIF